MKCFVLYKKVFVQNVFHISNWNNMFESVHKEDISGIVEGNEDQPLPNDRRVVASNSFRKEDVESFQLSNEDQMFWVLIPKTDKFLWLEYFLFEIALGASSSQLSRIIYFQRDTFVKSHFLSCVIIPWKYVTNDSTLLYHVTK